MLDDNMIASLQVIADRAKGIEDRVKAKKLAAEARNDFEFAGLAQEVENIARCLRAVGEYFS